MLIIESLTDKKRIPAYARDKVISLGDIAIYTNEKEVPLYEVLSSVKQKENGQKVFTVRAGLFPGFAIVTLTERALL